MSRRPSLGLRFSLATLLVVVTACGIALWWWQRPYTVETPEPFVQSIDGAIVRSQGRRVESFRRQLFDDPIKHGPTRVYYTDGTLVFEEWWQHGMRHGLSKRWGGVYSHQPRGQLLVELEFHRGALVRVNDQMVEDFMAAADFSGSVGERIRKSLQEETDISYLDVPLRDVADDIQLRHEMPILLDSGVSSDTLITSEIRGPLLFAGMCAMLTPLDLTCRYRYEVLWITTQDSDLSRERILEVDENTRLASQLAAKTDVSFRDAPLDDVLRSLASKLEVRVANESNADEPVTIELANVSLRSALGILLHKLDLYCEVDGDVLVIRDTPP